MWVYDECKQCFQLRQLLIKDYPQITIPSHSNVQVTKRRDPRHPPPLLLIVSPHYFSFPTHPSLSLLVNLFFSLPLPLSLYPSTPFSFAPPFSSLSSLLFVPLFLMSCPPPSVSGWYNYYTF